MGNFFKEKKMLFSIILFIFFIGLCVSNYKQAKLLQEMEKGTKWESHSLFLIRVLKGQFPEEIKESREYKSAKRDYLLSLLLMLFIGAIFITFGVLFFSGEMNY